MKKLKFSFQSWGVARAIEGIDEGAKSALAAQLLQK
jgi:hypothetical protein